MAGSGLRADRTGEKQPTIPQAPAAEPLTPAERRFAALLSREAQARAAGADPESLELIARARRAAGRACHGDGADPTIRRS